MFAGGGGVGTEIGLAGGDFGECPGGDTDAEGVIGVVVGAEGAGGGIDDVGGVVMRSCLDSSRRCGLAIRASSAAGILRRDRWEVD